MEAKCECTERVNKCVRTWAHRRGGPGAARGVLLTVQTESHGLRECLTPRTLQNLDTGPHFVTSLLPHLLLPSPPSSKPPTSPVFLGDRERVKEPPPYLHLRKWISRGGVRKVVASPGMRVSLAVGSLQRRRGEHGQWEQ